MQISTFRTIYGQNLRQIEEAALLRWSTQILFLKSCIVECWNCLPYHVVHASFPFASSSQRCALVIYSICCLCTLYILFPIRARVSVSWPSSPSTCVDYVYMYMSFIHISCLLFCASKHILYICKCRGDVIKFPTCLCILNLLQQLQARCRHAVEQSCSNRVNMVWWFSTLRGVVL